jgi:hypothetical protein
LEQVPYAPEQGIFVSETGNSAERTGTARRSREAKQRSGEASIRLELILKMGQVRIKRGQPVVDVLGATTK